MSRKSIAIIGAGIAGLAAGAYAQMNGYDSVIFEMHDKPGGLCTSWKRKGYTIDGCIHHLAGSGAKSEVHQVWRELDVADTQDFIFYDEIVQVEADGHALTICADIDRLEQHMKEIAPEDSETIDEYVAAARAFTRIDLLAFPILSPWDIARKSLPVFPLIGKYGQITLEQFAEKFKNPFLRKAFPTIQYDFPNIPMMIHLNFLAGSHNRTLGWPKGGSLAFARAIESRYRGLGGEMKYNSKVSKILVEGDRAVGVLLADGSEHRADFVISAADGHSTVFDMLSGQYADDRIRDYYKSPADHCEMTLQVSLGVAGDMAGEPHSLTYFLNSPARLMDREIDRLDVEVFNFDPTLAPAGKTVLKVMFGSKYSYWRELAQDRQRYEEEKARIAGIVVALLEERFPGIAARVAMTDVATSLTTERYTGNWQGLQAWTPAGFGLSTMTQGFTRTLPGLRNFHMAGQWAEAMIGVSTAAISGRKAIQRICKEDGKRFSAVGD
ncbi:MAG: phytoene desaturase family protein [Bacillota bacterium]